MTADSTRFGLSHATLEKLRSVFIRYPEILKVVVYGSRAKGNFKAGSDIDLTIEGNLTTSIRFQIESEIDDLLLPYKIDLSLIHEIENSDLLDHIHRVGVPIFTKT